MQASPALNKSISAKRRNVEYGADGDSGVRASMTLPKKASAVDAGQVPQPYKVYFDDGMQD